MNNVGLIGHNGFIGGILQGQYNYNIDKRYNRNNVRTISGEDFDLLMCAAPTGNRLWVNSNCITDLEQILFLIDHLRKANPKYFVLISTIDVIARPNTKYGLNRKILEGWVKSNLENYSIVRLPTLIHPNISKNILYDLKNNQYLDKINPQTVSQYYDLTNIKTDIEFAIENNIRELNLFSEPIANQEIIDRFFPGTVVGEKAGPAQYYDMGPYKYTKEDMLLAMSKYFNA